MIGMAYAVSDVSSDVRRAAVTNIGFVLYNNLKDYQKLYHY